MTEREKAASQNTVLVVDDELNVRGAISDYLEARSLIPLCAGSAESALRLFRNAHPSVVVTDVNMPGMDGIQLLTIIKEERPATAVIVITGQASERSAVQVLRAGAAYYLKKPFAFSELERLVRKCLSWFEPALAPESIHPYLQSERLEFGLPNDLKVIAPVVEFLWRRARRHIGDGQAIAFRCSLEELLINAMEHGNLGISFEEKATALEEERYWDLLQERINEPARRERAVRVTFQQQADQVRCVVTDEGDGFEWSKWCGGAKSSSLPLANGRGIFLARIHSHEVAYNDRGNQVTVVWRSQDPQGKLENF